MGAEALQPVLTGASEFHWLRGIEHELLLFAAFWFALGFLDELVIDLCWLAMRLTGRARTPRLQEDVTGRPLLGRIAVFVPAWREASVIGATIEHARRAWPQAELRLYAGFYRNDPASLVAAMVAAGNDPRVRLVVHDRDGPTTKADCLNRLYAALEDDERRWGQRARAVVLHDAEDMVHAAALPLIDLALVDADFVQLPVRPEPHPQSRWIGGHYLDEFAESHAKAMVVRNELGAALPAAGVGCAFSRDVLDDLARLRQRGTSEGPFEDQSLTEDYELGLLITRSGRPARFLRLRDQDGNLIATRSYFPARLSDAVRQKTRWVHGIAFQGWDRLGWHGGLIDKWMALRDRRGPMVALVQAIAYVLLVMGAVLDSAATFGLAAPREHSEPLAVLLVLCLVGLFWRVIMRVAFTAREYGLVEGGRAVLRIPIANIIAIMAGRRALLAYLRSLWGEQPVWDKTAHDAHPAREPSGNLA